MMLQPTPDMKRLLEEMEKATDQEEYDRIHEEYVKLLIERDKALESLPFVH